MPTTIHGESYKRSPEYVAWNTMLERCRNKTNPNYQRYQRRGIIVCPAWRKSFKDFLSHVGRKPSPKHSLDRIDNNGNYEPGNVRWATKKEQSRNRRDNNIVTINGVARCVVEWSEVSGVQPATIHQRIVRGWPPERLLESVPVKAKA